MLFRSDMMPKVQEIRRYIDAMNPGCELEVDGGVDLSLIHIYGPDVLRRGDPSGGDRLLGHRGGHGVRRSGRTGADLSLIHIYKLLFVPRMSNPALQKAEIE